MSVFIIKDKTVNTYACSYVQERGYSLSASLSPGCLPLFLGLSFPRPCLASLAPKYAAREQCGPTITTGTSQLQSCLSCSLPFDHIWVTQYFMLRLGAELPVINTSRGLGVLELCLDSETEDTPTTWIDWLEGRNGNFTGV